MGMGTEAQQRLAGLFFDPLFNWPDDAKVRAWLREQDPDELEQFLNWFDFSTHQDRATLARQELDRLRHRELSTTVASPAAPTAEQMTARLGGDPLAGHPNQERLRRLEAFRGLVERLKTAAHPGERDDLRSEINRQIPWVRRELIELGCHTTISIYPPAAIGGPITRGADPLQHMFDAPYDQQFACINMVGDLLDQAIGVLLVGPVEAQGEVKVDPQMRKGYAFIVMAFNPDDPHLDDVLEAIKGACMECDSRCVAAAAPPARPSAAPLANNPDCICWPSQARI